MVGDFGRSLRSPITVHDALVVRLPVTLELAIEALALALILAIPVGIQAALRPGSGLDVALSGLSVTSLSMPNFLLGILLIFVFAIRLRWLPSAAHVLGTDQLGRDSLSRALSGARLSLLVSTGTVVLSLAGGVPLGLVTGRRGSARREG